MLCRQVNLNPKRKVYYSKENKNNIIRHCKFFFIYLFPANISTEYTSYLSISQNNLKTKKKKNKTGKIKTRKIKTRKIKKRKEDK